MSGFTFVKTFDRYTDDAAPSIGTPAARGVWAIRITRFDPGAKIGFSEDNLRNVRALTHYRRKPAPGVEPFEVYVSGNIAFEYVTSPLDFDIFDGSLSPQSSTDVGANQVVVGPDAPGTTQVGNPVLIAGRETATGFVRTINTDAGGRPNTLIVSSAGIAIGGTPGGTAPNAAAMVGVYDGTNLQRLAGDTAGRLNVGANPDRKSYVAMHSTPLLAAAAGGLLAIEAGAAKATRIRRIRIWDHGLAMTTAGFVGFGFIRSTGASSGGGTQVPLPLEAADGAFSGVIRGENGVALTVPGGTWAEPLLASFTIWIPNAPASRPGGLLADLIFDGLMYKPITIPAGTSNGIALASLDAAVGAAGTMWIEVFLTEE